MSPADTAPSPNDRTLAFIGGGNMASALLGGLVAQGRAPASLQVVEPDAAARDRLQRQFGVQAFAAPEKALQRASLVVWAVKPQTFRDAAAQARAHLAADALHLSVAAGIRSDSIGRWLGSDRIVRAMPNTPALVGKGMSGLYARAAVTDTDRRAIDAVMKPTGESIWFDAEEQLDAVTALSGSGPAYVFLFLESMIRAGVQLGLSAQQAARLATGTFAGATELARSSQEPPEVLRERVTSKGGTTYAAITTMQQAGVPQAFEAALHAASRRAAELADEFGRN